MLVLVDVAEASAINTHRGENRQMSRGREEYDRVASCDNASDRENQPDQEPSPTSDVPIERTVRHSSTVAR